MGKPVAQAWTSAVAAMVAAMACGGEEPAEPAGRAAAAAVAPRAPGANHAPQITRVRLEPASPQPGERVRAVVTVRDPDGDPLEHSFRWELAGRELAIQEGEIELSEASKGDAVEVWVTAFDGRASSETAHAEAEVANRRPVLRHVALQPVREVFAGTPALAAPAAEDPDGDTLEFRYRWTVNDAPRETSGEQAERFDTQGLQPGDRVRVEVVASDGDAESDAAWSGVLVVANAAPEIVSKPAGVAPGAAFRYAVKASDPEGDRNLRFELRKGPAGMTLNPVLGEVSWMPRADQAGVHPIEIAVEDSAGARSVQAFEITVASAAPAAAPTPPAAREP
jgi:hypothetical protein